MLATMRLCRRDPFLVRLSLWTWTDLRMLHLHVPPPQLAAHFFFPLARRLAAMKAQQVFTIFFLLCVAMANANPEGTLKSGEKAGILVGFVIMGFLVRTLQRPVVGLSPLGGALGSPGHEAPCMCVLPA